MEKQIVCSTIAVLAATVSNPVFGKQLPIAPEGHAIARINHEMVRFGDSGIVPLSGIRRLILRNRPVANDNCDSSGGQSRCGQSRSLKLVSTGLAMKPAP